MKFLERDPVGDHMLDGIRHHREHVEGEINAITGMLKRDKRAGRGGGFVAAGQIGFPEVAPIARGPDIGGSPPRQPAMAELVYSIQRMKRWRCLTITRRGV